MHDGSSVNIYLNPVNIDECLVGNHGINLGNYGFSVTVYGLSVTNYFSHAMGKKPFKTAELPLNDYTTAYGTRNFAHNDNFMV